MKKCARCGIEKPLTNFYRDPRYSDGRTRGACKSCLSIARPKQVVVPVTKQCSKCGQTKTAAEFLRESRHADGLRSECSECFNSKTRYLHALAWRRDNPERVREYNAKQRSVRLRYQARWAQEDPDAATLKNRDSKQRQRSKNLARVRLQSQNATNRRRALKRSNGPHNLTRSEWESIKAAYVHACAYCSVLPGRLTLDHVLPLALGGLHTAWNVVPACARCNSSKGARMVVVPDYGRHPFV